MSVLSDKWIKKMAREKRMIFPFVSKQVRKGKISFGISSYGYDAREEKQGDLYELGVIDPALVVLSALEHAVSAADNLLSVACAMHETE